MDIQKIIIKNESGYGPIDVAYTDKITITESSFSYEYKPHPMSDPLLNRSRKWSYKTDNPEFAEVFHRLTDMTPQYLRNEDDFFVTDVGAITITAVFEDKHRESKTYFCPPDYFRDYIGIIRNFVPACEAMPPILWNDKDEE